MQVYFRGVWNNSVIVPHRRASVSMAVVLKLFDSWVTFVFQKPFACHKN